MPVGPASKLVLCQPGPYSLGWGYDASGGLGLIVLILTILLLMGHI
jgi:hypothetical protein